jgi:iron complex transport system permease protein
VALLVGLTGASALAVVVSVGLGAVEVAVPDVLAVIGHRLFGTAPHPDPVIDQIVWDIRLPRALLGLLVGASLAVAGAGLQALVRNPLADPYVLGVSAGASLAAVAVLLSGVAAGTFLLQIAAFLGALAALVLVYLLASTAGTLPPLRLVLAGVALSYAFSGITSYLIFASKNPQAVQAVMFWLLGSLGAASWSQLTLPAAALATGTGWLVWRARALDALVQGDETAATLGFDVTRLRAEILVVTSLVTGVVVAVSGGIGFVGLMVPHLIRLVTGPAHGRVLPAALLGGAAYLVLVDVVARMVIRPVELPIGVVTSVAGTPLFLWLLRNRTRAAA